MSDGILSFLLKNRQPDVTTDVVKQVEGNPELLNQIAADPVAANILESIRTNPKLRSQILGKSPEMAKAFRNIEDRLLEKKFKQRKNLLLGQSGAFFKNISDQLNASQNKAQLYSAFRDEMIRQTKLSRQPVDPDDVLAGLHAKGLDVKPIADDVKSLISKNREKQGLTLIHGNLDTAKLKNTLAELQSRSELESSRARSLTDMYNKARQLTGNIGSLERESTSLDKESSLDLFTTSALAEESKYRPTKILKERDIDLNKYIAELKADIEEKVSSEDKEKDNMSELEKRWNRPGNLLKYFIDFSSEK